ncbi:MAG: DNA cytosine methyltransferase [Firmicutes bacterium]|nr:DNA cytosine methyltransferase [Bacillota bacterium]
MGVIKGLSLFANVGIAEAYFEEIGIDILVANELNQQRADLYRHLYPKTEMICGDITNDTTRQLIIEKALKNGVDFVIATPPCQGMSEAGNRDPDDVRNQLIYYAIDVIKAVKPDYILLENVPKNLITYIKVNGEKILIPDYIKNELQLEYNFNKDSLIMAKDHGVPQLRERNIFLLVRKTLNINWEFPKKEPEVTLEDVIGDLPSLDPLLREGLELTLKIFPDFILKRELGLKVSKWHKPPKHSLKQVEWMMHTPTGKSATFNEYYYPKKDNGKRVIAHHNHYRRMNWNKPSRTITQNNGVISSLACVHPGRLYTENEVSLYSDPRVLTLHEIFIVMSLPENWNIPEDSNETFIRKVIGEGIPPLMVKKIMLELINKFPTKER